MCRYTANGAQPSITSHSLSDQPNAVIRIASSLLRSEHCDPNCCVAAVKRTLWTQLRWDSCEANTVNRIAVRLLWSDCCEAPTNRTLWTELLWAKRQRVEELCANSCIPMQWPVSELNWSYRYFVADTEAGWCWWCLAALGIDLAVPLICWW